MHSLKHFIRNPFWGCFSNWVCNIMISPSTSCFVRSPLLKFSTIQRTEFNPSIWWGGGFKEPQVTLQKTEEVFQSKPNLGPFFFQILPGMGGDLPLTKLLGDSSLPKTYHIVVYYGIPKKTGRMHSMHITLMIALNIQGTGDSMAHQPRCSWKLHQCVTPSPFHVALQDHVESPVGTDLSPAAQASVRICSITHRIHVWYTVYLPTCG